MDRRQSAEQQASQPAKSTPPTDSGIDLRNYPVADRLLLFLKGDNITPPQQALDWIFDSYDNVDEIVANGQGGS